MNTLDVALIQLRTPADQAAALAQAAPLIREAAARGARLIATPEGTNFLQRDRAKMLETLKPAAADVCVQGLIGLAGQLGVWLLIGSALVRRADGGAANRSMLVDPNGRVVAAYDKIHMFDVDLPGGESYRESATYRPGTEAVVAALPWGLLGMTVCYDVRFPQLYRALAHAGADFISVPSAFTRQTGLAHWHVLLRARAIETGAYVFAPAQCGEHPGKRLTYGHSLIVDPWGAVLADGGEAPGFVIAEIDPAKIEAARRAIPSLNHDRDFATPSAASRPNAAE